MLDAPHPFPGDGVGTAKWYVGKSGREVMDGIRRETRNKRVIVGRVACVEVTANQRFVGMHPPSCSSGSNDGQNTLSEVYLLVAMSSGGEGQRPVERATGKQHVDEHVVGDAVLADEQLHLVDDSAHVGGPVQVDHGYRRNLSA